MTESVNRRVVVHFPGFERMDTRAHHGRFERTARHAAKVWNYSTEIGPLREAGSAGVFSVSSEGSNWRTSSTVYLCDHNVVVDELAGRPVWRRIVSGYVAAARVVGQGGLFGYFRHAWRFALFFLFPFCLMAALLASGTVLAGLPAWMGLSPWHFLWSVPLAALFVRALGLPFCERFHTLHLFSDWELAVAVASPDDALVSRWLEDGVATVVRALQEEADEYLISSHSMGSSLAAQVMGMVLERHPGAVAGKRVIFVTLGGAILQCALLQSATALRRRIGLLARSQDVAFLEVQCLTDVIHFYKSRVVAVLGHADAPQATLLFIRVKHILAPERYRRIKRDFLRVHRQYVLHGDIRGAFDFTLLTTGPFPARLTSDYSKRDFQGLSDGLTATRER